MNPAPYISPTDSLFFIVLMFLIMSYGLGYLFGGPDKGKKVVAWEFKMVGKSVKFILEIILITIIWGLIKQALKKR